MNLQSVDLNALRLRLPEYLAARGVELRLNGSRLVGKCPVHDDNSPSFAVFGPHHEACGCYPCGFSGDVFDTSQWLGRSDSFPEAVAEVAAALGVYVGESSVGKPSKPSAPRPAKEPEPPFTLSAEDIEKIHLARLDFDDAFFEGNPIIDRIAESLCLNRETLRLATWGACGLALAEGWLCYAYPQGFKWRNPDPQGKPRFRWILGKATAPWRMENVMPETTTILLTEGESDCLALIEAEVEADGTAVCVASPGTSFLKSWAPLFAGKRVILCFDFDPPGQAASLAVAEILKGHAAEVLTWKGMTSHE